MVKRESFCGFSVNKMFVLLSFFLKRCFFTVDILDVRDLPEINGLEDHIAAKATSIFLVFPLFILNK